MQNRVVNFVVQGLFLLFLIVPVQPLVWGQQPTDVAKAIEQYAVVDLTTDLSQLTAKQRQMLPLLMEAGKVMDNCFWYEAYGAKTRVFGIAEGFAGSSFCKNQLRSMGPLER